MSSLVKSKLAGLTPLQIASVSAVFVVTLLGAIALTYLFHWWNGRMVNGLAN